MKTFRYIHVKYRPNFLYSKVLMDLNELGAKGWEVVQLKVNTVGKIESVFLKREELLGKADIDARQH